MCPVTHRDDIVPYLTKDGSAIRELMHPAHHGNRAQSLAEATVPAGGRTLKHRHRTSEELYCFLSGRGWMTLEDQRFAVTPGDTVAILPGMAHALEAAPEAPLVLLCCCSPPYDHEDTELLENMELPS